MEENNALPWQRRETQRDNQASPPHLNSNLDVRQIQREKKKVRSENNLRMSGWLLIVCVLHSEAT